MHCEPRKSSSILHFPLRLIQIATTPEDQSKDGTYTPPAATMAGMNLLGAGVGAQGFLHLLASYLAHQRVECFIDVMTQCSRCLEEGATELIGQILALLGGDTSLRFQIHLIGYQHQRYVLGETNACDEFTIFGCLLKAMAICDWIADDETFAATHVLVPHGCELDLASSVEYVQQGGLIVDYRLLLVRVLCDTKRRRRKRDGLQKGQRCAQRWQSKQSNSPIVGSW